MHICRKLNCNPANRCWTLAAVGAGWHATRPAHGVKVLGVTLSDNQTAYGDECAFRGTGDVRLR